LKKPLRMANRDGLAEFVLADQIVHTRPASSRSLGLVQGGQRVCRLLLPTTPAGKTMMGSGSV
jgi:hypothetical protein